MSSTGGISFANGFNSGLPIDDIITQLMAIERKPIQLMEARKAAIQKDQTAYSQVQTKVNELLTAIKKMTARNVATGNGIFENMAATSSNDAIATATASSSASPQSLTLEVKSLPSQTRAISTSAVSNFNAGTTLSSLGITNGTFSVFVNGVSQTFTIADATAETIGDLMSDIDAAFAEITSASVVDGKIVFEYDENAPPAPTISFGAGGDTSNFLAKTRLNTAVHDTVNGRYSSSQRISTINLSSAAVGGTPNTALGVTSGTFKINGVTFNTQKADTTEKTISELISEINASGAKVSASYNAGSDTFQLVSKDTGGTLISLEDSSTGLAGGSNFLTAMGLVDGVDGSYTEYQTAGKNTEFVLNGVTMYSTSTTIDETVHGLTGVSLNLKSAQVGTTVTINIQQDKDALKTAIKDVVAKYNDAIKFIDTQTDAKNKATLAGESRLTSLRNQIRSLFTSSVGALSGNQYDSLQQIGISTGAIGGSAGSATAQLQFDESKFDAAMAASPATVRKLIIGQDLGGAQNNTTPDDNMLGIFTQLHQLLSDTTYTRADGTTGFGALYNGSDEGGDGLFYAYSSSVGRRIETLDKSIEKAEERLEKREKTLRQQFLAMDKMVGQFNSQGSALNNLINQLNASNK